MDTVDKKKNRSLYLFFSSDINDIQYLLMSLYMSSDLKFVCLKLVHCHQEMFSGLIQVILKDYLGCRSGPHRYVVCHQEVIVDLPLKKIKNFDNSWNIYFSLLSECQGQLNNFFSMTLFISITLHISIILCFYPENTLRFKRVLFINL